MSGVELAIDLLLGFALLITAGLLLNSHDFLKSAVLFIAFGLFMSVAWVRLAAPDIALAEAAIGTGITGVLLMDAIRHMEWEREAWAGRWPRNPQKGRPRSFLSRAGPIAAMLALAGILIAGVVQFADQRPGLAGAVAAEMKHLEHPVTAVLLVFRGLDTWLELGILLLAVLGMLTARGQHGLRAASLRPARDPVLEGIVRVLAPLAVLTAVYLLWLGTFAAGGAFQAGVILGASAMLLWLSGYPSIDRFPEWLWKLMVTFGFGVFTLAAVVTQLMSGWMLEFPEAFALEFIKSIEIAASISIGTCFAALFVGQHPGQEAFEEGKNRQGKDG
jgi:multisubunit Na+/H+ antiporter MnhB subunit